MRPTLLTLLIVLGAAASAGGDEPVRLEVVVNSACPATSITRTELSRLFLKKSSSWAGGDTALPVDQPEGSPLREEFARSVHRRSTAALRAYWQQEIFSGHEVPPPEKAGDAELLEFVAARRSAIGYVTAGSIRKGVKVLPVVDG